MQTQSPILAPIEPNREKNVELLQSKSSATTFYYPQLDGLRTLAFLLVFGAHAGGFTASKLPAFIQAPVTFYNDVVSFGWQSPCCPPCRCR